MSIFVAQVHTQGRMHHTQLVRRYILFSPVRCIIGEVHIIINQHLCTVEHSPERMLLLLIQCTRLFPQQPPVNTMHRYVRSRGGVGKSSNYALCQVVLWQELLKSSFCCMKQLGVYYYFPLMACLSMTAFGCWYPFINQDPVVRKLINTN